MHSVRNHLQVIAAAQAGKHNEKRESYGDSIIIDPWGTVIARLPGIPFSPLYFFELGFFCVSSLGLLCSRFIWLLKCLVCYFIMLHQSSIFLHWNAWCGIQLACITCCMFVLEPSYPKTCETTVFYTYIDAIAWLEKCGCRSALHWICSCRSWFVKSWGCENSNANFRGTSIPVTLFQFQPGPEVLFVFVYNSLLLSYVLQHRKFDSDWKPTPL
jgi:hypothetical protein